MVVRRLKTWCVSAPRFEFNGGQPDRQGHQAYDRNGLEVLSEEALETIDLPDLPA